MAAMPVGAGPLGAWLEPFAAALGRQTWRRAVVLVTGALLSPGRRTVTSALRAAGPGNAPGFANYHKVLGEGRWSAAGAGGSAPAGSTATRCAPRTGTS